MTSLLKGGVSGPHALAETAGVATTASADEEGAVGVRCSGVQAVSSSPAARARMRTADTGRMGLREVVVSAGWLASWIGLQARGGWASLARTSGLGEMPWPPPGQKRNSGRGRAA